jgi:methyl-accepting chemotaxis protein
MKFIANLKIGAKLTLGFAVVSVIAAVIGIFGIVNIRLCSERSEQMYSGNTKPVAALEQVAVYFQRTRVNMLRIIMSENPEEQQKYSDRLDGFQTKIDEGLVEYGQSRASDTSYADLQQELITYIGVRQQVIELAMAGKQDDSYQYSIDYELDAATAVNNILDKMFEDNVNESAVLNETMQRSAGTLLIIFLVLVGAGIAASVVIGVMTTRSIVRPTRKLISAAERLAAGDVDISIRAESKDELGTLMTTFSTMIENIRQQARVAELIAGGDLTVAVTVRSDKDLLGLKLQEMVRRNNHLLLNISGSSQQVTAGAQEVANSSMSLAQGATEQASAIEELSATVEEIAQKTKTNALKAGEAKSLAEKVKNSAVDSTAHVGEMLNAMEEIRTSSESISKILSVIDNIAFQTNILALNAAVEAARAGEHGKGFAVVASEVKNLAEKSAKAAKEVSEIITGSTGKVRHGQDIATVTADSLNGIAEEIRRVSSLVSEISSASDDQAISLTQIKSAIDQVSEVIMNNSSLTESTAAASQELSGQACILLEMVEEYKLDDTSDALYLTA